MNNFPRKKLCELIKIYGKSLCDDPLRCEGLLRDFCGKYKTEIFILVSALGERVPADLLKLNGKAPIEIIMVQLTKRLQTNLSLKKCAARWGVESWALALAVVSYGELDGYKKRRLITPSREVPAMKMDNNLPQNKMAEDLRSHKLSTQCGIPQSRTTKRLLSAVVDGLIGGLLGYAFFKTIGRWFENMPGWLEIGSVVCTFFPIIGLRFILTKDTVN